MATYRLLDPKGDVVETTDIESAGDAHAWFVDKVPGTELGWRMEVQVEGDRWDFVDDSEGDRSY